eukprot:5067537-Pyramimonas_sp.AAC.1
MGAKVNESCSRVELAFLFQLLKLSAEEEHDVGGAIGVATNNISIEVNYCEVNSHGDGPCEPSQATL